MNNKPVFFLASFRCRLAKYKVSTSQTHAYLSDLTLVIASWLRHISVVGSCRVLRTVILNRIVSNANMDAVKKLGIHYARLVLIKSVLARKWVHVFTFVHFTKAM